MSKHGQLAVLNTLQNGLTKIENGKISVDVRKCTPKHAFTTNTPVNKLMKQGGEIKKPTKVFLLLLVKDCSDFIDAKKSIGYDWCAGRVFSYVF